jgi:hypothetical protein
MPWQSSGRVSEATLRLSGSEVPPGVAVGRAVRGFARLPQAGTRPWPKPGGQLYAFFYRGLRSPGLFSKISVLCV